MGGRRKSECRREGRYAGRHLERHRRRAAYRRRRADSGLAAFNEEENRRNSNEEEDLRAGFVSVVRVISGMANKLVTFPIPCFIVIRITTVYP